jgi:hypothetical protein
LNDSPNFDPVNATPSTSKLNPFMVPVDATDGTARTPRASSRSMNSGAEITPSDCKTASMASWHTMRGGFTSVRMAIFSSP